MPLMLTEKKLYLVDFCELIRKAQVQASDVHQVSSPMSVHHVSRHR